MNRKAFHQLLRRYLDGNCSSEESQLVDQWYNLLEEELSISLTEADFLNLEDQLWARILQKKQEIESEEPPVRRVASFPRWLQVAAAVLLLIAGGIYFLRDRNKEADPFISHEAQEGMVESSNNGWEPREVRLEDGSAVCLRPDSKIAYPRHFTGDKREVYLEGEAFFTVARNRNRPFFVYNKNLVAEVLGTSFNIRIVHNSIEVAVKTGRVAVFENGRQISQDKPEKANNGVIVNPNQKVTYYAESGHFVTALVDTPVPVTSDSIKSNMDSGFVFDDAPLAEVLKALKKTYQIEIFLENESLGNCPFTGDLRKQPLFKKLELVCQVFRASYEVQGTSILIKGGKGCS